MPKAAGRLSRLRTWPWQADWLIHRKMWDSISGQVSAAVEGLTESRLVLDIGCGERPYAHLFGECSYVGLDFTALHASPSVRGDGCRLPFADASFDLVYSSQVIEHVPTPWLFMQEISRVLRPGGIVVLTAPAWWPLHEEPYDFFRFTRYGLESLAHVAGLKNIRVTHDGGWSAQMALSCTVRLKGWWWAPLRCVINVLGAVGERLAPASGNPVNLLLRALR